MEHTDNAPYFIEPGDDQGEYLGEPLCIVRERGEDDRRRRQDQAGDSGSPGRS